MPTASQSATTTYFMSEHLHSSLKSSPGPAAPGGGSLATAWTLGALALLGFGPLLAQFFINLWKFDTYQFFPAALLGCFCLAVRGLEEARLPLRPGQPWITGGLVVAFMGLLGLATWLWSPWLGVLAWLLAWLAGGWWLGGWSLVRSLFPAWFLWLTVVPPPLSFDQKFALQLQEWAVFGSSHVLAWLAVPHALSGTLIDIPGRQLLVEEACSGINSVLFMTSTCVFYAMWRRRSLVFLAVLYALTIGCVLAGNLVRITSGAWLLFNWDIDLFSGARHEALGMALTAVYLGFIVGAEWVLGRLTGRPNGGAAWAKSDGEPSGVEWRESLSHWRPARRVLWLAVPLAVVFAGQVVQMRQHMAGSRLINPAGMDGSARFTMPPVVDGWRRVSEASPVPTRAAYEDGVYSHIWRYERDGITVTVSLDYPFFDYHDVTICYALAGWTIGPRTLQHASAENDHIPCLQTTLRKEPNLLAELLFSTVDENGVWLEESPEIRPFDDEGNPLREGGIVERLILRLRQPAATAALKSGTAAPNYRVQLLAPAEGGLSDEAKQRSANLFRQARRLLTTQFVRSPATPPPAAAVGP
jgi:exosortase